MGDGSAEVGALEAIGTAISIREFRPDPVPDDVVEQLVWAATRASNPGNSQLWDFLVVRDHTQRQRVAQVIRDARQRLGKTAAPPADADKSVLRRYESARNMLASLGDIPAFMFICGTDAYPTPEAPRRNMMYAAMYAAAQNAIVAARALGLGLAYTTLHLGAEDELRALFAMPDTVEFGVTMPMGWPARPYGRINRRPIDEVLHLDRW
jgi:nitroreductase